MKKFLNNLNLSKLICTHLIGVEHKIIHRRFTGAIIMIVGISLVHLGQIFHSEVFSFFCEVFGAGVHGVGLIPFVDNLSKADL